MDVNKWFSEIYDSEKTILENFENFLSESKKTDDIIAFMGIMNAKIILQITIGEVSEKLRKEILDFYYFFNDNYEKKTRKARMKNWPIDALILRMGSQFAFEDYMAFLKDGLNKLPKDIKREARTLVDKIFGIRKNKYVYVFYANGKTDTLHIPGNIPRTNLENCKTEVLFYLGTLMCIGGDAVVVLPEKNSYTVFGVSCKKKKWAPISKTDMQWMFSIENKGNLLSPDENVTYTEISKSETFLS